MNGSTPDRAEDAKPVANRSTMAGTSCKVRPGGDSAPQPPVVETNDQVDASDLRTMACDPYSGQRVTYFPDDDAQSTTVGADEKRRLESTPEMFASAFLDVIAAFRK